MTMVAGRQRTPQDGVAISVIVPVYNDFEGLARCLGALAAQSLPKSDYEVVIVDNGSRPGIADLAIGYDFASVHREGRPGSYNARNRGVLLSRGELLAFTDADCIPAEDWLERAVSFMQSYPGVSAIGGEISMTVSPRRATSELFELTFPPFSQRFFVNNLGFAATANLITRRSVFDAVGAFDGSLMTGGDVDWSRRLRAGGLRLVYSADVLVMHPARSSVASLAQRHRRLAGGRAATTAGASSRTAYGKLRRKENLSSLGDLALRPQSRGVSRSESFRVLLLAAGLLLVRQAESIRVRLGGRVSR